MKYDCIIAGFGTAGSIAAITAGRLGLKTLVLDRNTAPGGTHTTGGVCGCYQQEAFGLLAELHREDNTQFLPGIRVHNFSESGKYLLERDALAAGVEIHYEAALVEVLTEGRRVTGVRYLENDELHTAEASVYLDGTGEGALCRLAGCAMSGGRKSDGVFQPFTNTMLLLSDHHVFLHNFDAGRIDPYREPEFSDTVLASYLVHRKEDYGVDTIDLVLSDILGVREGRHIDCGDNYTLEKFFRGEEVKEPLVYVWSNLDTHAKDLPLEDEPLLEWLIGCSLWGPNLSIPVPKQVIFPKEFDNLIAPGRQLGVDHDLGHALRMNSLMGVLGEAAAQITALAVRQGVAPRDVPYRDYAATLPLHSDRRQENEALRNQSLEAIRQGLDSDRCGEALWASRNRVPADLLAQWLEEAPAESPLRCHSAFALALQRDSRALPELRRMAALRDEYRPTHSRKYNHKRGYVSVFYLGCLRDAESIGLLGEIFGDDAADPSFEYQTHALGALLKIGDAHVERREEIADIIRRRIARGWMVATSFKVTGAMMKRLDTSFRIAVARSFRNWGVAGGESLLEGIAMESFEEGLARREGLL